MRFASGGGAAASGVRLCRKAGCFPKHDTAARLKPAEAPRWSPSIPVCMMGTNISARSPATGPLYTVRARRATGRRGASISLYAIGADAVLQQGRKGGYEGPADDTGLWQRMDWLAENYAYLSGADMVPWYEAGCGAFPI